MVKLDDGVFARSERAKIVLDGEIEVAIGDTVGDEAKSHDRPEHALARNERTSAACKQARDPAIEL